MDDWPDELKLFAVLSSVKVLLETVSKDEGWDHSSTPDDALQVINKAISFLLDPQQYVFPEGLSGYFAPTGPLQEISLSNGWGEIYLKVSEQYDKYAHCLENKKIL
jgi:hypothetical protein